MKLRDWQQEAYDKLKETNFQGVIKVASGKGKTVLAIRVIQEILTKKTDEKVLVVVPTINLMEQWKQELKKFLPELTCSFYYGAQKDESGDVVLSVINTAAKLPFQSKFILKVFDEIHHYGAPLYTSVFSIQSKYTIGLSATPQREDEGDLAIKYGVGDVVYTLDHIDELLEQFSLWSIRVPFTKEEYDQYSDVQLEINRLMGMLASMYGVYDFMGVKRQAGKKNGYALKVLKLWGQAARLKYCATHKLDVIKDIVAIEKGQKIIIFSESIEFAQTVGDELPESYVVHSKLAKSVVLDRLKAFREASYGVLIAPRMIDEGYDVPDASVAIVSSFSRSSRQMIQRDGRILRMNKDKYAKRYTLVLETIEENKYYSLLERTSMVPIAREGMWVRYRDGFDDDPSFLAGMEAYLQDDHRTDFLSWVKKKLDYFEKIYRDPITMTERIEFFEQYEDIITELVEAEPERWPSMKPREQEEKDEEHYYFSIQLTDERKRLLKEQLRSINSRLQLPDEIFHAILRFIESERFSLTKDGLLFLVEVTSDNEPGIWPKELFTFLKGTFVLELLAYK